MRKTLLSLFLISGFCLSNAQRWEPSSQKVSEIRREVKIQYAYRTDINTLIQLLKNAEKTGPAAQAVTIHLPTAEGKIEKFAVYSNPVMEKSLMEKYGLGSYVGVGIDDPSKYIRFSTSPNEIQSMIIKDGVFQFIEPITADKKTYGVFYKTQRTDSEHGFTCNMEGSKGLDIKSLKNTGKNKLPGVDITGRPAASRYRTYRLALSATGEYTQLFGGVAGALAQMNATMTRVNGVFEKEFAIHLNIQNLPNIIYANPANDPYTNDLNGQLQQTLTAQVGNDNYDIGHVFNAAGGNGNAGCIGCICTDPTAAEPLGKGSAFTQNGNPVGDTFDIDYVAHEMGHQLGGNHTFSTVTEGSGVNIEPGGGTTIMAYAGITANNVQMNSDAYFHYSSINQILNNLEDKPDCGVAENIANNNAPAIAPLISYNIPKGTAYYLEANAVDADGDQLTYNWEQYDSVSNTSSISGDSGWGFNPEGSLTRSYPAVASGRRYFPSLPIVMSGKLTNKDTWETVSYIPRVLHYAVSVRDNNANRPLTISAENTVTVGNDGPFKFKGLSTSSVLYNNASNTISWDVANTNLAPYNAANVKIEYTTDVNNGAAWTELITSTPNDGSFEIQMPAALQGNIKLRISAVGNIFYAVSPTITVGSAPASVNNAPTGIAAFDNDILKTSATVSWNHVPGATYSVNYRKVGTANWSNAVSPVNSVLLNNLEDETSYEVSIASVINNVAGAFSPTYNFKTKGLRTGYDYCLMTTGGNTTNSPYFSGILRVTLANVDLAGNGITVQHAYKDYSEDPSKLIQLTQGAQYNLNYIVYANRAGGNYQDWIQVWIDYNRNGIFEASERIGINGAAPDANKRHQGSFAFAVPANAYNGDKTLRMRVASGFFNASADACTSPSLDDNGDLFSRGSVWDFSVKINAALAVKESVQPTSGIELYPNPADTFIEVKNIKGNADYKIYSADGRLVQEGRLESQKINVASLIKGMYVITIKDDKTTYNTKLIKK
ncbi:reprolysin-like metallopeptidase [Chryseobacterium culicis]|uniref:Propanediol utilization protein n=1 Tax=Chryseobacterium culicis TaxID=680127 RepID=A0A2S9CZ28_CHRCI|nr:zinc-dependent metalloprotease family protein [Chryseobacterium culicis]PRB85720.1 propanediol utilization protein [Chryseobacterium culicis]PRB90556.1 propanediol utilization protein [Chryseobacterium culicis]